MPDISPSNKRIAKNTLMLYIRMLFTMLVSLYTSRVVLNTLGVEDYGIYNVVGGIISMFAFVNSAMVSSTQRYLNFSLATDNETKLRSVFSTSLQIHALIALVIIILGETAGLWFLKEKLVIPESRMTAAMWVYQCSIAVCAVNIMSAPFNADIIAHEKMSVFAYISILDVTLKLAIVFLLTLSPCDKLIAYALLLLCVQILITGIYAGYCLRHFPESHYKAEWNKPLYREMFGFAGWSFFGNMAAALYTQGLNMMLNIFFGPVVNAARGIAVQVQSAVQQFVNGFQTAISPQITKTYAVGDLEHMHTLMFRSARFSFLLLYFLSLPILLETDFLLRIWLKTVPENAVIFTQIMICISLIYTTANPCVKANQATGKVKAYQIVVGGTLLTIIPISYVVLKLGAPAYSVFIVHFCVESIAQFLRMFMLKDLIHLPVKRYLKNIYIPVVLTVAVSVLLPVLVRMQFDEGWLRFIIVGFTCVISVGLCAMFLGLTRLEREFFRDKAMKILKAR
jgi:O-antigen/teichoic acid export membrane protein